MEEANGILQNTSSEKGKRKKKEVHRTGRINENQMYLGPHSGLCMKIDHQTAF